MKYKPDIKPASEGFKEEGKRGNKTVVEGNGKLDFGEYELELWDLRYNGMAGRGSGFESRGSVCVGGRGRIGRERSFSECVKALIIPLIVVGSIMGLVVLLPHLNYKTTHHSEPTSYCSFEIVETIPQNLTFSPDSTIHTSIYEAWVDLLSSANKSIDIAAFYWTLLNDDVSPEPFPSSNLGEDVFERLKMTGLKNGVKIRIAQNEPTKSSPQKDSAILASVGAAEVRSVDFKRLMSGGVLHTKMWLVDDTHLYLGSANMDWRSLTQVKEVGIVIYNCSTLALDMKKIFEVYWQLGTPDSALPPVWPSSLSTQFNISNQLNISFDGHLVSSYLSSSPPPFCPLGRSKDHEAIVDIITKAEKFVYISVMEYFPKTIYEYKEVRFWPVIDDALRAAAISRKVRVRLLASLWNHTRSDQALYLRSLSVLSSAVNNVDIDTRLFVVPSYTPEQEQIPFGRVNHDKYMVTDQVAYIGTSNWSADYFINTGGVGLVINDTQVSQERTGDEGEAGSEGKVRESARDQLQALFERDWNSEYAKPLLDVM